MMLVARARGLEIHDGQPLDVEELFQDIEELFPRTPKERDLIARYSKMVLEPWTADDIGTGEAQRRMRAAVRRLRESRQIQGQRYELRKKRDLYRKTGRV